MWPNCRREPEVLEIASIQRTVYNTFTRRFGAPPKDHVTIPTEGQSQDLRSKAFTREQEVAAARQRERNCN
jgi:hypothetical protein